MTEPAFEKIEQLLREYPVMKSKLNIKIIQSKNQVYSLPAINYAKVSGGETKSGIKRQGGYSNDSKAISETNQKAR